MVKLIIYNDRSTRLAEFMYLHMIDYDSSKEYDGMKLAVRPAQQSNEYLLLTSVSTPLSAGIKPTAAMMQDPTANL